MDPTPIDNPDPGGVFEVSILDTLTDISHDQDVSLEDALDLLEEHQLPSSLLEVEHTPWLERSEADGGRMHKTIVCYHIITPNFICKPHERLWRFHDYTYDLKPRISHGGHVVDSDAFLVHDLFATMLCCGNSVFLVILKCIAIDEKGTRVDCVNIQSLPLVTSEINFTGQVLSLRSLTQDEQADPMDITMDSETDISTSTDGPLWIWDGSFVKLTLSNPSQPVPLGKSVRKTLAVKVGSHLCHAINPTIIPSRDSQVTSHCTMYSYMAS
ncbi:hypothetical protein OF83DRAFT_1179443 [Amylostereum chailletii]|nr:hypothetical protein OF83DRAFT_1179443 [Amylostereum chailletii]